MDQIKHFYKRSSVSERNIAVFISLFIWVAIIYGRTVFFEYAIDDQYYLWLYIEEGSSFKEYLASLRQRFWAEQYRPITFLTILTEALIFGKNPSVHHFFNLIYYTLLCFVVYKVVSKIFAAYYKNIFLLSFGVAILFLVHPSHANVVSSIKNREVILSLLFGLLALYSWLVFMNTKKFYLFPISLLLLLFGVFSKLDIITYIAVIPIIGFLVNRGNFRYKRVLLSSLVFIGLAFIGQNLIFDYVAFNADTKYAMQTFENPIFQLNQSLIESIPYSLYILSWYEKFMIWPFNYFFYFGFDVVPIISEWQSFTIFLLIAHLFILGLSIYLLRKKEFKYLFGIILFFIPIIPFAIVKTTGYFAVRYSFIASLGFCILAVQFIYFLYFKIESKNFKKTLSAISLLIFLGFSFLSYKRSLAWKNIDTLYSTDIPKIKNSANANRMACLYYYIMAEEETEIDTIETLIKKSHQYCDQALSVYEIGQVLEYKAKGYIMLEKPEKAEPLYRRVLELQSNNEEALSFLAFYNNYQGNHEQSIHFFEQLIQADSNRSDAYIELTQLYNYYKQFQKSYTLNKSFYNRGFKYDALLNFGDISLAVGDTVAAIKNYELATKIKKEDFVLEEIDRLNKTFD